jgi:tetratricopeptide (TPR) repeat protein
LRAITAIDKQKKILHTIHHATFFSYFSSSKEKRMKKILLLLFATTPCFSQQAKLDQAKIFFESQKYLEAKKILAGIDDEQKEYAAAQYYLGRIAFEESELGDAADYFEEATEANDKNPEYYTWLGDTYGSIAKDANPLRQGMLAPKMKNAWEKAIALDAKNLNARSSLIEYYTQAPGFMGGSFEKAHEVAKQIKKLNVAEGHLAEGRVYSREEKFVEAEKEFIAMVKADPKYLSGLSSFYANRKQYDKAFALYDEQLKKTPDDMSTIYQAGRLSAVSGLRLEQGEAYLKKYLNYEPKANEASIAGAYMRLANIYEKKGNKPEAKKHYEKSLKLDATMKEAKEGLERVK